MTKDKFVVQPFQLEDFFEVVDLLQDVSEFQPAKNEYDKISRSFMGDNASIAYVCKIQNRVIGFASMFFIMRIRGGKTAIIEDVVVCQRYRGEGIGKSLILRLIDDAQKQKCFKIELATNHQTIEFYKNIGFLQTGIHSSLLL
jgi:GNAT superfamily N-acetyltransferase